MENTQPTFQDITDLVQQLQAYPVFENTSTDPMTHLSGWVTQYSREINISKGFLVNRCALYWTGYDHPDGFDGQAFVDSCQDSNGSLRQLAQILDTDLQIFELDPHTYTKRSADELAMAASYGMMGIEEGTQLFCACSFGQGVEAASKQAISQISSSPLGDNWLENFMTTHCGLDHAAIMGVAIAGILKGIPVILEGQGGKLVKTLLETTTGKRFDNLILTADMTFPINHDLPGHEMVMTAILLKSLYAASEKTDCGKVRQAA